jgi:hypothetical protein
VCGHCESGRVKLALEFVQPMPLMIWAAMLLEMLEALMEDPVYWLDVAVLVVLQLLNVIVGFYEELQVRDMCLCLSVRRPSHSAARTPPSRLLRWRCSVLLSLEPVIVHTCVRRGYTTMRVSGLAIALPREAVCVPLQPLSLDQNSRAAAVKNTYPVSPRTSATVRAGTRLATDVHFCRTEVTTRPAGRHASSPSSFSETILFF